MKEPAQTYTYTAQRGAYITSVCTLAFLFLIDVGFSTFLIFLFVHTTLLKLILFMLIAALYFLLIGICLLPLWTKHRLTGTHLHLHYGLALKANIPRIAITEVQPVHERLTMLEPLLPRHDAKKDCIVAAFSDQGQVLLRLDRPHAFKVGRSSVLTATLLINVDKRSEFLAALNTTSSTTGVSQSQIAAQRSMLIPIPASPVIPSPAERSSPVILSEAKDLTAARDRSFASLRMTGHEGSNGQLPLCETIASTTIAICIECLTRRFGTLTAVNNLHMAIRQGETYGFLGSNGAGKTTTMKMLVGLLQPDEGRAWIAGHDVWAEPLGAKAALGYVPDRSVLYERLTGREFLAFLGQLRGMPLKQTEERMASLLDLLELTEHADRLCGAYSFGMKRKLSLAAALLHQPQVLILDEPLNGLDPRSARHLKDLFTELAAAGTSILLSTHDLATAEAVCHRIGIIHHGRLLAEGSASELRQAASASDLESVFLNLTADQQSEEVLA